MSHPLSVKKICTWKVARVERVARNGTDASSRVSRIHDEQMEIKHLEIAVIEKYQAESRRGKIRTKSSGETIALASQHKSPGRTSCKRK
jgi:hypothetical protein